MSRYQELAEHTARLIADGLLRPGERLPSVRQACRIHAISPVTVTQAYYLLESRGLIEARPRSGYFVRAAIRRGDGVAAQQVLSQGDGVDHARSSSLIEVLERVCASTRFTITAQARLGDAGVLPGRVPGTTTEYGGTLP